jgi:hypothetical protein
MLNNFEKSVKLLSIDYFCVGLRRLSATLDEMEEKANDSQSEDEDKMESYGEESLRSEKIPTEDSKSNEADEDSIQLGEEGKEFTKAELQQEGILFRTQYPSLGIFINKKVGFRKKLRSPRIQILKLIY